MNIFRVSWALAVLHALAGCAVSQETRRSLNDYTQAMSQVTTSADAFLVDFANGLKAQHELERLAKTPPPALPREFPAELKLPDGPVPPTEAGRRVTATRYALVILRTYNDTLTALVEGKSENEMREGVTKMASEIKTLATLAGATLPILGPLLEFGPKLAKLAQDASNRKQLEQAIENGREPVDSILQALEEEAPVMYRQSVQVANQATIPLAQEILRKGAVLKALIARHSPPKDAGLVNKASARQALVGEIGRKTRTLSALPVPFIYTTGKPVFDATADAETTLVVESLSMSAQKYAGIIARQNAYHDSMQKFLVLLGTARSSMDALVKSLSAPRDFRTEANHFLGVAFDLRNALATYRNPTVPDLQ